MTRLMLVLALATAAMAGSSPSRAASEPPPPVTHGGAAIVPLGLGADYAIVDEGVQAPDFTFESSTGWLRLHDLRASGHVLLVFAPSDDRLAQLESEREALRALGVLPVAVLDRKLGACRRLSERLHLGFPVVPDPRRVIGAQYNALDPDSRADSPAWFVMSRDGRVRRLAHGSWPDRPWTEVATSALGLTTNRPASFPKR